MTDHAELRRLAKAATPGARYQGTDERVIVAGNGTIICTVSGAISGPSVMADAEFLCATDPNTILALLDEIDRLKAENEALRKDAERWRYARTILPYEVIQDAQKDLESWNVGVSEAENKRCDEAIDAALKGATQ
ncbi:TPA: ead/Ea22-like family protein [Pseudomonas aeruginosa]|nr:ead/Ea22-like family protein [Pseudomonas aeruginosa]HED8777288.1 ead/Ea22-like family protein [Pseudomonas aeruginosa]